MMNNLKNISMRQFLARRGIQPKYERNGYGMYLSPLAGRAHAEFQSGLRAKSLVRLRIGRGRHIAYPRDAVGAVRQP